MCCRYYYDQLKVDKILKELHIIQPCGGKVGGTITPGSESLVLKKNGDLIQPAIARWGFPAKDGKLIINARCESVMQKPMFCNALETRRCILPAQCFYEWDADRNKHTFSSLDSPMLFLAGIWQLYDDIMRFVVLTTAANVSMMPIHDRMPLLISEENMRSWLLDAAFAAEYLKSEMPLLKVYREYEQMSFL